MTTLFIKNMVCNRCIMVVQNELDKLGLDVKNIKLGEVTLDKEPTTDEKNKLDKALILLGFELIDDKKSRVIEKIKNVIIDLVHCKLPCFSDHSKVEFLLKFPTINQQEI